MRISDWSSDVCSSDLAAWAAVGTADVTRDGEHASVQLDGRGRDGGMVLKTLRATTPSGTLDARGDIAWQPATGWKLDATLDGFDPGYFAAGWDGRSEEHTSELQSLMRISYAVFCLKKKT